MLLENEYVPADGALTYTGQKTHMERYLMLRCFLKRNIILPIANIKTATGKDLQFLRHKDIISVKLIK